jgi:hypothetical protein
VETAGLGSGEAGVDAGGMEGTPGRVGKLGRALSELGGKSTPEDPIPDETLVEADVSAWISKLFSLYHQAASAQTVIQRRTRTAVIRVKMSPALTPKAL